MKILIAYASVHHNNTEKVAKAMANEVNGELLDVTKGHINTNKFDFIGIGSGIYAGKFHKSMLKFIEELPKGNGKKVFVYSTSSMEKKSYNGKVVKALEDKGYSVVGSFSCKGYDTFGPFKLVGGIGKGRPNKNDLDAAREFVRNIE